MIKQKKTVKIIFTFFNAKVAKPCLTRYSLGLFTSYEMSKNESLYQYLQIIKCKNKNIYISYESKIYKKIAFKKTP